MSVTSKKAKVNPDLVKERKKCSFNNEEFTNWWYGGEQKVKEKRWQDKTFLEAPELQDKVPLYYLSHKEVYEETIRKLSLTVQKIRGLTADTKKQDEYFSTLLSQMYGCGIAQHGNLLGVHYGMFLPTILGQGTDEQQAEWVARARNLNIIGTYAQTELGHGTFVRGLETTATYDEKTQEFVLNSPTLSSYKWWPGGLAHSANHCILMAQLITQGKRRGVFAFLVQIRDTDTHMPLPGVRVGEIGAKFGFRGVNNGFLGFENVRIPRNRMLMRNAQVLEDGRFVKAKADVLTYGTMVFVRVYIVIHVADFLAQAATIAIRYSAVRKQSQINPSEPEVQIMDHLTQQYKLFPQLAKSIVFKMTADYLTHLYNGVVTEVERGQLERLPEMHALSCCLKAISTTDASEGFETCRLACGGHGYMASSNFSTKYGFVTAAATYEGENTIMFLQTARYLIKAWRAATNGQPLEPSVAYLSKVAKSTTSPAFQPTLTGILEAFQFASGRLIQTAFENVERRKSSGLSHEAAVNATSIELAKAAEMHGRIFIIESTLMTMQQLSSTMSAPLFKVLQDIVELYVVDSALQCLSSIMPFIGVTQEALAELQVSLESVLGRIRPNAVGLVDSFDFHDKLLDSTLGSYDGNVYERLMEEALKSPLNQEPVNKSFELYLKPLMQKSKM